jgi:hypothetical protein
LVAQPFHSEGVSFRPKWTHEAYAYRVKLLGNWLRKKRLLTKRKVPFLIDALEWLLKEKWEPKIFNEKYLWLTLSPFYFFAIQWLLGTQAKPSIDLLSFVDIVFRVLGTVVLAQGTISLVKLFNSGEKMETEVLIKMLKDV